MKIKVSANMKSFMDKGNFIYPFNEIRKTRSTMECKWVILSSEVEETAQTVYHTVLCASLPEDTLQDLMISQHAVPLPSDLSYCMDNMHDWGQDMDMEWYCGVVQMLASTAQDGFCVNKKGIVRDSLEIKVMALIHLYYGVGSPTAYLLMHGWADLFDNLWRTTDRDFYQLYLCSTQYINNRIHQIQNPVVQPVLPTSSA
jgi:hypothetical protein